ncbi:hypothetical protein [Actinomycetospora straminea]|uniref:Uncharacterized protein n=1 Tax=Actinomycetospora straminea TaxID=663607 RepID=A0ABP9EYX6_9PSEU
MSTATLSEPRTRTGTRSTPRPAAPPRGTTTSAPRPSPARTTPVAPPASSGTAPFVLLIMVLLTGGLVATLWLSTAAAADSYRLDEARQVARDLSEQSERLHRDVEAAQSAPALAAAARAQGMVPAGDPAVLLVAPDGTSQVIGDARPAQPTAPPAPTPAPVPPAPGAAGTTGAQAATDGQQAAALAGAATAEDRLVAVPSGQDQPEQAQPQQAQPQQAQPQQAQPQQDPDGETPQDDAAVTEAGR